ncbi:MAG: hypothetical protein ACTSU5_17645 [Promethearchaeota archaeon]
MANVEVIPRGKRVRTKLGLSLLLVAIVLVYVFSALKFLYIWSAEATTESLVDWDAAGLTAFWTSIGYSKQFRYNFIFCIIGIFVLALVLVASGGPETGGEAPDGSTARPSIMVIEDDVIIAREDASTEELAGDVEFLTLEDVFDRKGAFRRVLKVANILALGFILVVAGVFVASATTRPGFMYSDVGHILFDVAMTFELVYFLLRCPDFVKSLAGTGFRRAYLTKIHLHESFLGLLLCIGGIMLVINGAGEGAYFERMTGIVLLILGAFLAGRDWKDFARGKFLHD